MFYSFFPKLCGINLGFLRRGEYDASEGIRAGVGYIGIVFFREAVYSVVIFP
jgi:hypothetical protein